MRVICFWTKRMETLDSKQKLLKTYAYEDSGLIVGAVNISIGDLLAG